MPKRHFSLEEAHALIPQVQPRLRMALQFHAALRPVVHAINDAGYDVDWEMLSGEVEFDDEARPVDLHNLAKARALYESLRAEIDEVEALGCEVKGVVDGLVDFPSWRAGAGEVSLCWRLGEPKITHFHEVDAGFAGRRAVSGEHFAARPFDGLEIVQTQADAPGLELELREPESRTLSVVARTKSSR